MCFYEVEKCFIFMRFFLQAEEGLFRGHEIYSKYCEVGLRPGQCIRAYNYGVDAGSEPRFAVGLEGKLYNQNKKEVFPEDVLNGENGWGFDGIHVELLSDEIIMKL